MFFLSIAFRLGKTRGKSGKSGLPQGKSGIDNFPPFPLVLTRGKPGYFRGERNGIPEKNVFRGSTQTRKPGVPQGKSG